MMRRTPWILALVVVACGGDRPPPEPPPDPTEPFEDPVTSTLVGSGGVATTGPMMQNAPALVAKSTESVTATGGTLGTSTSTSGHPPGADEGPIPHGPVGVGGMGAVSSTGTLDGAGVGGRPQRGITSDGSIR